jgi:hypothetical protein
MGARVLARIMRVYHGIALALHGDRARGILRGMIKIGVVWGLVVSVLGLVRLPRVAVGDMWVLGYILSVVIVLWWQEVVLPLWEMLAGWWVGRL